VYGGDTFNFPINRNFELNSFFGGPNVYNAGDQYTNNSYTNNHTVTNQIDARRINVQIINGRPLVGPAGPQGIPGVNGVDGIDGMDGLVNAEYTTIGPYARPGATTSVLRDVRLDGIVDITYVTGVTFDSATCTLSVSTDTVGIPTALAKTRALAARPGQPGGPTRVVRRVF
jgi:hypothetical protein